MKEKEKMIKQKTIRNIRLLLELWCYKYNMHILKIYSIYIELFLNIFCF